MARGGINTGQGAGKFGIRSWEGLNGDVAAIARGLSRFEARRLSEVMENVPAYTYGEVVKAIETLQDSGFIRTFIDRGVKKYILN